MKSSPENFVARAGKRPLGLIVAVAVVLIIIIILVILSGKGFLKSPADLNQSGVLTDTQKIEALQSLPMGEAPISDAEKIKALTDLPLVQDSISDAEKLRALNSL
ncbi:MAG: hypothetical protein WCV68_02260 [Candidatus Paceibacterota bacterium]|jgi:hypothetical protein